MTPKEYFQQIFELDKEINSMIDERDKLMNQSIKATRITHDPIYNNQVSSPTEDTIIKLFDHSNEINKYIDKLVELKIQISKEIMELENKNHRMVLRERYMCSKKWEDIAEEQNYDKSWIIRLHGRALLEFKELNTDKFKTST